MASRTPTHPDEKLEALDPELEKILDEKLARADRDEKQSVPLRPAIEQDRRAKPRTSH